MKLSKKAAYDLLEDLLQAEKHLNRWRKSGIGLVMEKETFEALSQSDHPGKGFVLQGVLVDRRGKLRF